MNDELPPPDQPLRVADGVLSRVLEDDTVLLDLNAGMYFGLNEVGGVVWAMIKEGTTVGAVRERLLETFDVEPQQLDSDLIRLLEALADRNLVNME